MANAIKDQNRVDVMTALSDADGTTIQNVSAIQIPHTLKCSDGSSGTDHGNGGSRDGNRVPVFYAVSATDGVTPVAIYADSSTGALLIRST